MIIIVLLVINVTGLPTIKEDIPKKDRETKTETPIEKPVSDVWIAPDTTQIKTEKNAAQIIYGRDLIANTSFYLGPKGKVQQISNGMNCQNCHLNAGTKPFGNNYSAVASTYPKFRERSGSIETIYKRVNDCFERSLNGKALDSLSNEMQAIVSYIKWLGKDVPKGEKPKGCGITDLTYLDRPADPEKGKIIYMLKCKTCHMENGGGKFNSGELTYQYPPLWGEHSYNKGAGLFRLSRFAGYVKSNMPQNTTFDAPQLTDEEAWDVAAFVNSQPRPDKDLSKDWPKIAGKPVDHPFGPYVDKFTELQHKYGPFGPIAEARKKTKK
ncbi:MAG TPA: c-type cytochrome [Bacteroidia bacterium]|nr:c-type cytochrome [Bacteroidia bacterium]